MKTKTNIMKQSSIAMATALCVGCFSLWSCNSQDPSAAKENEKTLVEATAKIGKLEEQIDDLKTENATLTQKASHPESKENGLTAAQVKAMVDPLAEQLSTITKKLDSVEAQTKLIMTQNENRDKENQAESKSQKEPTSKQKTTTSTKENDKYDIKLDVPMMGPGSRK